MVCSLGLCSRILLLDLLPRRPLTLTGRSRKIDFEAEVRRMEAREKGYSSPIESDSEKDDGLRISEVPPSVPQ